MTKLPLITQRTSVLRQLANFTSSTAGLDLSLRLINALVLIGAGADVDAATVKRCSIAASQIGLARRYLRFFCFLDCFLNVQDILDTGWSTKTTALIMELVESSCLGMYLILEGTTMLHDMNIFLVSWYTPILLEANKFWFYAICIAIARSITDLLLGLGVFSDQGDSKDAGEKEERTPDNFTLSKRAPSMMSSLNRLVIDSLDLTIPGSLLGWIPLSDMGVAIAILTSTILVWPAEWAKAQR